MTMKTTAAALLLALARARSASAAVEWSGAFPLDDATHKWSMQADADGNYPDASMRIVVVPAETPGETAVEAAEESATAMIDGDDCPDYQSGATLPKPAEGGTCYNLVVDPAADSLWTLKTDGLTGISVFAQHVPIEFERDMHYFQDSEGTDIEPAHEEGGDGHAHDHGGHGDEEAKQDMSSGHKCACEAEEMNFAIDCAASQPQLDALAFLKSNGCANPGSCDAGTDCERNYLIVQSHHDHCPEDQIPKDVEDGFHDYDTSCRHCDIDRIVKEGADECPEVSCTDRSGNQAYADMVTAACQAGCDKEGCGPNYLTLKLVHDLCPHDTLTREAEDGLHDLEDVCEALHPCNVKGAETTLTCEEDDKDEHDHAADHADDEDKADAGNADEDTADAGTVADEDKADAGTESKEGDTSGAAAAGSLLTGVVSGLAMLF